MGRGLALLPVALLAAACTSGGPATKGTTTVPPSLVASVTPRGWVPVDYGDAQISVPADWNIFYGVECVTPPRGQIFVGHSNFGCRNALGVDPFVTVTPFVAASSHAVAPPSQVINGIVVWHNPQQGSSGTYDVPSLGVSVGVHGAEAAGVIKTLTHSPATVVLAKGPAPAVPSGWKRVVVGGIRLAVPASWPTTRAASRLPECGGMEVVLPVSPSAVVADTDQLSAIGCVAEEILNPQPPRNGVVVDLHPSPGWFDTRPGQCLTLGGLTACPYDRSSPTSDQMAETDILFVKVTVPGRPGYEVVEIGLAGNGMVARTILHSLRPA